MKYVNLGRTGLEVSALCLGAMTFGRESTEEVSVEMLNRFKELGGNFIDTANVYGHGVSEEILGRWLATQHRDEWVIATKVRFTMKDAPNQRGLSRKHIIASAEASLRRLQTDHIDLYQIHMWHNSTPIEETLSALDTLVQQGKVRYIGASNVSGWQLQKAIDLSRQHGWSAFVCLQPLYNLLDREVEWELVPVCQNEGVGIIPWSPLRGGWLSGKFRRGMTAPLPETRVKKAEEEGWTESWSAYNTEQTWQIIDALLAIAEETGRSPAQVALNWLLQQPAVTAPILGARNMTQFEDNMGAATWDLTPEQTARLTAVSDKPLPYPYNYLRGWM